MEYSYFPGCTLKNKAQELDTCGRISAEALGFHLEEIPEWQCCGGTYPLAEDEIATKLASVRALAAARDAGHDLLTLCSACFNVIKQVNEDMKHDKDICFRANNYLKLDEPYTGTVQVVHFLQVLRDTIGWDTVRQAVKEPLSGLKIGAYYGCLLLRPSKVMQFDDPEDPTIMEDFIKALGAEPIIYSLRNECCGAYLTLENKEIAQRRSGKVLESAQDMGVDFLITACPLCQYNLTQNALSKQTPVYYFTLLLAHALGLKEMKGVSTNG
ncbi:MAG: CoB--CoM heterodisulfide reductase iron-sulfur subunit B family protein [Spirochaetia bacterium]|jgi:heterodisulfide reductase subunit B|nr:CoB--CoM heterodisulfide reductase iron-sulfur subunit B family protein [Spirochaetia bacterium]